MKNAAKFSMFAQLFFIFILFIFPINNVAASDARSREILETLNRQESLRSRVQWSDTADAERYDPRGDKILNALDQADYSRRYNSKSSDRQATVPAVDQPAVVTTDTVKTEAVPEAAPRLVVKKSVQAESAKTAGPAKKTSRTSVQVEVPEVDVDPSLLADPVGKHEDESLAKRFFDFSKEENELKIAVEVFDYQYREPGLMKTNGTMYGVLLGYLHRFYQNPQISSFKEVFETGGKINVLKADMRFSADNSMKYRSEGSGTLEGEQYHVFETRLMGGYEFPVKNYVVTPYAGLGYRYLNDHTGRKTTSTGVHSSYDRETHYWYIPLGLDITRTLGKQWSLTLNLEYDYLIGGRQKSYIKGLGTGFGGVYGEHDENNLSTGHGYRGSFEVAKDIGAVVFFIEPFFRLWHIEESDHTNWTGGLVTYEPDNRTYEYGARVGVRF